MPLRGIALLEAVRMAISRIEPGGALSIADSSVSDSPDSWSNRSVSWEVAAGDLAAQMVVWEDGNAELDLVNMATVEARSEHRQIDDTSDVQSAVKTVCDWLSG